MCSLGTRVLVVEDDVAIRDTLVEVLEDEGFQVVWAANGAEALASLKAGHLPDVILLDVMMPVMDGFAFRQLQRKDPRLARIPTVVLTAGSGVEARLDALAPHAFLPKPFELGQLIDTVERLAAA
jgi:CheY-like chemotaxis protein